MESNKREQDENVTVVCKLERILRDGGQVFSALIATIPVDNQAEAPYQL